MCSGKKVSFPKEEKLLSFIQEAEEVYSKVTVNPKKKIEKAKTIAIYQDFISLLDNENMEISL